MSQTINLTGQKINEWTVLKELGGGKILVQCSCGTVKEIYKKALINGKSKSCGCLRALNSIKVDDKFGEWTVIKILPNRYALCKCSCGNIKEVFQGTLKNGMSQSCGCRGKYKEGKQFGYWTVIGKSQDKNKLTCRCICGTEKDVFISLLQSGKSMSCGCKSKEISKQTLIDTYGEICTTKIWNSREPWQVSILASEDAFRNFIKDTFEYKPTTYELCNKLAIQRAQMLCVIHKYNAEDIIDLGSHTSGIERDIKSFVESTYNGNIIYNDRKILDGLELDIYIPEKKVAIEINGMYWHSEIYKDKNYHFNKTMMCNKLGIRLMHIFDYEWNDLNKREIIKSIIKSGLNKNNTLYARDLNIKEVDSSESKQFLKQNHLQGECVSSIYVALVDDTGNIQMMMTFGKSRFSSEYDYEIHRLCNNKDVNIIGGASKCLRYFINRYKPNSIVSYADNSKFTGKIYESIGFKFVGNTQIGYKWANGKDVLTRYQTQKHILLANGLGREDETESDIMHRLGYFKVYDCGNVKYIWINKVEA